ncbi:DUF6879 family protein [Nocardia sp. NPDC004722]
MQFRSSDPALWATLFRECERDAFHLETRDSYSVPHEAERLRRFLNGEPPPYVKTPWQELMRETTGRGVPVTRVRVVTVPHTDYHRWLLSVTGFNVDAGEDIRYVPRNLAGEVPPDDWWLMDGERVVYNLVDEHGGPAGIAITADRRLVEYCETVRQRLWKLATPYAAYAESPHVRL